MYIDFTQFQQFVNRLLFNSSQSISKFKELSIDPARIVEVKYYDDNGNLQTVNVPNINKVINDVQSNINSIMYKIIHVDPTNGNDNNNGTAQNPVQTIKRAVELVPTGGRGYIVLRSDTHTLTSDVDIIAKMITIVMDGNCTLTTNWYDFNGVSSVYSIRLYNSFLRISTHNNANATILIPPKPSDLPTNMFSQIGFIRVADLYTADVTIVPSAASSLTILVNDIPFIRNTSGIANIIINFNLHSEYNLDFNINNGFLVFGHGDSISLLRLYSNRILRKDNNVVYDPAPNGVKNLKALLGNIIYYPNTNIPANYVINNPVNFGF